MTKGAQFFNVTSTDDKVTFLNVIRKIFLSKSKTVMVFNYQWVNTLCTRQVVSKLVEGKV